MFHRKLERRLAALERDWSPLINAAIGESVQAEARLQDRFRAQTDEMIRRQIDAEAIIQADHSRLDELELTVENVKPRPLFGPRERTG